MRLTARGAFGALPGSSDSPKKRLGPWHLLKQALEAALKEKKER